jgi:hypothetical protein
MMSGGTGRGMMARPIPSKTHMPIHTTRIATTVVAWLMALVTITPASALGASDGNANADRVVVQRCERDGRIVYSDAPCARGARQRIVDVDDRRSDEDRRAAEETARRDAAFARSARAQRADDERRVAGLGATGMRSRLTREDSPSQAQSGPAKRPLVTKGKGKRKVKVKAAKTAR